MDSGDVRRQDEDVPFSLDGVYRKWETRSQVHVQAFSRGAAIHDQGNAGGSTFQKFMASFDLDHVRSRPGALMTVGRDM